MTFTFSPVISLGVMAAGAMAGYLYYKFIGCKSGVCPLTASPYGAILFGMFLGLALVSR